MSTPKASFRLRILFIADRSLYSTAALSLLTLIKWPARTSICVLVLSENLSPAVLESKLQNRRSELLSYRDWPDWGTTEMLAAQITTRLRANNLAVETEICDDQPVEMLLKRARDGLAHLIVIGAKRWNTPGQFELDPAVHRLACQANCSVLVARPLSPAQPLSTILAVDGSSGARRAVEFLSALPLYNWAKITVVNVVEENLEIPAGSDLFDSYSLTKIPQVARQAGPDPGEAFITEVCTTEAIECLHDHGAQGWDIIRFGDPVDEILNVAQERKAALIAIGAFGQTGVEVCRLGSVAEQLIKEASCSVLAVR